MTRHIQRFRRRKKKKAQEDEVNPSTPSVRSLGGIRPRGLGPGGDSSLSGDYPKRTRSGRHFREISQSSIASSAATLVPAGAEAHGSTPHLSLSQDALVYSGFENLTEAIEQWRQAVAVAGMQRTSDGRLSERLEELLDQAETLAKEMDGFLSQYCPDTPDGLLVTRRGRTATTGSTIYASAIHARGPTGSMTGGQEGPFLRKTMSILSDDSFMSALDDIIPSFGEADILIREPLSYDISKLMIYQAALKEAQRGRVPCRVIRAEALQCSSDEDFLAKLHCLREVFNILLSEENKRDWLANEGKVLIGGLMSHAGKDTLPFYEAYDKLLRYVAEPKSWPAIAEELNNRQVPMLSFYDVVLDFILLDAFEDLARPPASALAVAQNRFLSASFKESTLSTVVWSVLKAKRARLQVSDGFIAHFYDVSEVVSPTMAWGFLGTDESLRDLSYYFKEQICCFLSDVFSFERVRYNSYDALAEDVWTLLQSRAELTEQRIKEAAVLLDDTEAI